MFENIVIRQADVDGAPIDPGLIAEAMLFYQNVHLLLDRNSLSSLLRTLGPDLLIRLIDEHSVKCSYIEDQIVTRSSSNGGVLLHNLVAMRTAGDQATGQLRKRKEILVFEVERALGNNAIAKKFASKFLTQVGFLNLAKGFGHKQGIPGEITEDYHNDDFMQQAVQIAVSRYVPNFVPSSGFRFRILPQNEGIAVDTNLDYEQLTKTFRQANPGSDISLTTAQILSDISQGCLDLRLSENYMSEYVTTATSSMVAAARLNGIVSLCLNSTEKIDLFQEVVLENLASVRDSINSGDRSFEEFLELLGKSSNFRDWTGELNPDNDLITEYTSAISAEGWLERAPSKVARFSIFTTGGLGIEAIFPSGLGVLAGIGLSAADSFLLEKILGGWKPSHFVSGPLREFVG